MHRFIPSVVMLLLITISTASPPLAATTAPQFETMPNDSYSRSQNWRSVLLYGEFDGPAFDNYFNRQETLRFIVSAENGGRLHQFVSLDYPEQPRRVFLGEIAINQKEVVLTAQAIHSYLNPARSYQFPIMNAQNQQLLSFESAVETATLPSDHVVHTVTIKVTGNEGWFTNPAYEVAIIEQDSAAPDDADGAFQPRDSTNDYN